MKYGIPILQEKVTCCKSYGLLTSSKANTQLWRQICLTLKTVAKNDTDKPTCRARTETQTQRRDMWTQLGGTWEIRTDICALPCVKQIASGKLLSRQGAQSLLCGDLDVGLVAGEREIHEGGDTCTHIADSLYAVVQQKLTQYCKAIILQQKTTEIKTVAFQHLIASFWPPTVRSLFWWQYSWPHFTLSYASDLSSPLSPLNRGLLRQWGMLCKPQNKVFSTESHLITISPTGPQSSAPKPLTLYLHQVPLPNSQSHTFLATIKPEKNKALPVRRGVNKSGFPSLCLYLLICRQGPYQICLPHRVVTLKQINDAWTTVTAPESIYFYYCSPQSISHTAVKVIF